MWGYACLAPSGQTAAAIGDEAIPRCGEHTAAAAGSDTCCWYWGLIVQGTLGLLIGLPVVLAVVG